MLYNVDPGNLISLGTTRVWSSHMCVQAISHFCVVISHGCLVRSSPTCCSPRAVNGDELLWPPSNSKGSQGSSILYITLLTLYCLCMCRCVCASLSASAAAASSFISVLQPLHTGASLLYTACQLGEYCRHVLALLYSCFQYTVLVLA